MRLVYASSWIGAQQSRRAGGPAVILRTGGLANVGGGLEVVVGWGGDGMLGWRSDRGRGEHGSLGLGFRGLGVLG